MSPIFPLPPSDKLHWQMLSNVVVVVVVGIGAPDGCRVSARAQRAELQSARPPGRGRPA